jgi:hypothetical protein
LFSDAIEFNDKIMDCLHRPARALRFASFSYRKKLWAMAKLKLPPTSQ